MTTLTTPDFSDVTAKPSLKSTSGSLGEKTASVEIVWEVQGEALADAGEWGVFYAALHPDIPRIGDTKTMSFKGETFEFICKSVTPDRKTPQDITVSVTWETVEEDPGGDSDLPSEEKQRRIIFNVPYNERLDIKGHETQESWGYDRKDWELGLKRRVPTPEPISRVVPNLVWKFDINVHPKKTFWTWAGDINSVIYPPVSTLGSRRPFVFRPYSLMYLGASGGLYPAPHLQDIDGFDQSWVYKLTFEWAFSANYDDGWRWIKQNITAKRTVTYWWDEPLYWFDFASDPPKYEVAEGSDGIRLQIFPAEIELPILVDKDPPNKDLQEAIQVRPPGLNERDFHKAWECAWGWTP